jgi:hypothetical protein
MGNPIQFSQQLEGMDRCKLDAMHKEKLDRGEDGLQSQVRVPSRFCSFHLAGFDLDDKCESLSMFRNPNAMYSDCSRFSCY